jgi:hypothetical protein
MANYNSWPFCFNYWRIYFVSVSVEMADYNLAIVCGIEMRPSILLEENGRVHFMAKRFNREQIAK